MIRQAWWRSSGRAASDFRMSAFQLFPVNLNPQPSYLVRSNRPSPFKASHLARRGVWDLVWLLLFRPSPRPLHAWRRFLLRMFGANVERGVRVYPAARIWAPWNLTLREYAVLGPDVN